MRLVRLVEPKLKKKVPNMAEEKFQIASATSFVNYFFLMPGCRDIVCTSTAAFSTKLKLQKTVRLSFML